DMNPRLFRLWELLAGTRLFAVASRAPFVGAERSRKAPEFRFDDLDNASQMFAVINEHLDGVYATERELEWGEVYYRFNVEAMVAAMRDVGARTMILSLSQNFADWPPGASSHRKDLDPTARAAWDAEVAAGDQAASGDACAAALEAYERALAIDDTVAELHYKVARCERSLEHFDAARAHYRR